MPLVTRGLIRDFAPGCPDARGLSLPCHVFELPRILGSELTAEMVRKFKKNGDALLAG